MADMIPKDVWDKATKIIINTNQKHSVEEKGNE